MFAQKTTDPTGVNPQGLWTSPHRDIAHIYPYMIRQAIELASQRIDKTDCLDEYREDMQNRLGKVAVVMAKFVRISASDPTVEEFRKALEAAELAGCDEETINRFNNAFVFVMNQVYFQAIREAVHNGKPLGFAELMKYVEEKAVTTNVE